MKRLQSLVVFAALFSGVMLAGNSHAAIRPYALSLTPFAGGYVFEGNQRLEDQPIYGLAVGYNFSERWGSELVASYIGSEVSSGEEDNVDVYLLHLDLLYHFRPEKQFVPYFAAGLGGLSLHPGGESDEDFLFNYGIGLKYFLFDNVALRADARHILDINYNDSEREHDFFNNLSYTAGVTFQFGGSSEVSAPREVRFPKDADGDGVIDQFDRCPDTKLGIPVDGFGCPLDVDRDGVYDFEDRCPDTPMGVKVDRRGCAIDSDGDAVPDHLDRCPGTPAGTAVDERGCPRVAPQDTDGDGVEDSLDKCPDTPRGTAVDEKGCPRVVPQDTDGDGVEDSRDKCPNTPAGIPVNDYGCPRDSDGDGVFDFDDRCPGTPMGTSVGPDGCPLPAAKPESLTLLLEFNSGEAAIRPDFAPQLQAAAGFIQAHPGSRMLIEGHTDSVGSDAFNMKLSQQRAETVRSTLIEKYNVAPESLEAKGFGETRPVADNGTPEGRQQNRRVVVTVVPAR